MGEVGEVGVVGWGGGGLGGWGCGGVCPVPHSTSPLPRPPTTFAPFPRHPAATHLLGLRVRHGSDHGVVRARVRRRQPVALPHHQREQVASGVDVSHCGVGLQLDVARHHVERDAARAHPRQPGQHCLGRAALRQVSEHVVVQGGGCLHLVLGASPQHLHSGRIHALAALDVRREGHVDHPGLFE